MYVAVSLTDSCICNTIRYNYCTYSADILPQKEINQQMNRDAWNALLNDTTLAQRHTENTCCTRLALMKKGFSSSCDPSYTF